MVSERELETLGVSEVVCESDHEKVFDSVGEFVKGMETVSDLDLDSVNVFDCVATSVADTENELENDSDTETVIVADGPSTCRPMTSSELE